MNNDALVKMFADAFLQPDCDIPEMVESRTKMYLNSLLYTRARWTLISGWRFWGHNEVFDGVVRGLDATGVKYKTKNVNGFQSIYIYSKQSKFVNQVSHNALDSNKYLNDVWRAKLRPGIK